MRLLYEQQQQQGREPAPPPPSPVLIFLPFVAHEVERGSKVELGDKTIRSLDLARASLLLDELAGAPLPPYVGDSRPGDSVTR